MSKVYKIKRFSSAVLYQSPLLFTCILYCTKSSTEKGNLVKFFVFSAGVARNVASFFIDGKTVVEEAFGSKLMIK